MGANGEHWFRAEKADLAEGRLWSWLGPKADDPDVCLEPGADDPWVLVGCGKAFASRMSKSSIW
jgi:hypothetical protein